ncbi:MAG TPA: hypothetical protein VH678_19125 [Xanthobacteraceae bacterium]|jgi:hypothetical protein
MPFCEADPWRLQYFADASCPADVSIPTEDCDAWLWYPAYRWVYDKIAVAHSQGLDAAPHGVMPSRFPVFSKPITNLRGMGVASRTLHDASSYVQSLTPGHMWMTLLQGRHVSSDVVIVRGEPRWWRHVTGEPSGDGTFDYWTVHAAAEPAIEDYCGTWIARHLGGYTGILNIETIGGRMIEVHLRMSDQWPDLYGTGWVDAVVRLYAQGKWDFADHERRDGYSVVLFGPHGPSYRHPPAAVVARVRNMPDVSSVQITFHEQKDPQGHAMPPGGFRLAIVNAWSLAAGLAARDMLGACLLARAA